MTRGAAKPPHYDDLAEALSEAWRMLAEGVADRNAPLHTPTLATLGLDGRPRARVVVLRAVDVAARSLRIHADARSDKVAELARDPRAALLGYDAGAKVQIRAEGRAVVHTADAVADAAWGGSRRFSQAVYGTSPAPGSRLAAPGAFALPENDAAIAAGRANFTAVTLTVERLEWLYLDHDGHRRALFQFGKGEVGSTWLAP